MIGSGTPALGAVVVSSRASALLWGILVRWRLRDPGVLHEILVDVTVGLSKTHFLSLTFPWHFTAHTHTHTNMSSLSAHVLASFLTQPIYMCRLASNPYKALFFSASVTLSSYCCKNLKNRLFSHNRRVIRLFICLSFKVKRKLVGKKSRILMVIAHAGVQNIPKHCHLSAALKLM